MDYRNQILVVEDNEVSRVVMRIILERAGYDPFFVGSGSEAIRAFAEREFDLVILECNMSGLTGYQTASKLREIENKMGSLRAPILGISAATEGAIRGRCAEAGIDDVIGRPFRAEEIVEKVNLWCALTAAVTDEVSSVTVWQ